MTVTGRVPLVLLLGLLALVVRPGAATALWWAVAVVVLVVVDVLLAAGPATLEVTRRPVGQVRQGEETRTDLTVMSTGRRRVRGLLRDAWQPSAGARDNRHRLALAAGEQVLLRTPLVPLRRGDLRSHRVTVRCIGPLGLAGRQRSRAVPGQVRVLPPFGSRKHLPSRLARLRELDGRAAVRVRGQGTEFDSLRDYVRGDDVRSIDWRATARSRTTVVRTWQPERQRRVLIVLDTSRTSAGRVDDVPRLDSSMDAALLLAALAARAGDTVDFLAGDRTVRARLRGGSRTDVLPQLVDAMAGLQPVIAEADWSRLSSAVVALGRHPALVVLLTSLDTAAVEHGLLPALPALVHRHRVVLASVRDPELDRMAARRDIGADAAGVYDAAAAEQVRSERARTAEMLGALGVDVVDARADHLPVALTDHYLMLKGRGLL
ncbi:MAG: DUF58 domain-containing protein [Nocardioidaceae bacterium]